MSYRAATFERALKSISELAGTFSETTKASKSAADAVTKLGETLSKIKGIADEATRRD